MHHGAFIGAYPSRSDPAMGNPVEPPSSRLGQCTEAACTRFHAAAIGADCADRDIRATIPRFSERNRDTNQALLHDVRALASTGNAIPGQVALAWLLAQHLPSCPSPAPEARGRIDENTRAASLRYQPTTSPTSTPRVGHGPGD
jgi:hypothetical protein